MAGMNVEMAIRGLALRLRAEAALGAVGEATLAASRTVLAGPPEHPVARLALTAALGAAARAGLAGPAEPAVAWHEALVEQLAATLTAHPAQEAAFRRTQASG